MSIDRSSIVLFDASCLVAAARSPNGGSGYVLSLCRRGYLRAAVSQSILLETETNVEQNFPPDVMTLHRAQMAATPMMIAPVPPVAARRLLRQYVNEKDDHVLAAAIVAGASLILTLDRAFADEVNRSPLPMQALSPGEFIQGELLSHPDVDKLRDEIDGP